MNELENVKVGDLMIVSQTSCGEYLQNVERVTNYQIIVDKRRFWKKNGRLVGAGIWCHAYIRPATENDIERIKKINQKNELLAFIRKADLDNLSLESLQSICDIVKKEIGDSAAKQ